MIVTVVQLVVQAIVLVIIVDVILSWVAPNASIREVLAKITSPLYAPVHLVLNPKRMGGIDIAPLVVIIALQALGGAIVSLVARF